MMTATAIAAVTITLGLLLDATGHAWARILVVVLSWAALAWVAWRVRPRLRLELALCVLIGILGELFLIHVLGLYSYRGGELPAYVPAGHALVYASAVELGSRVPGLLPRLVVALAAPWAIYAAWAGIDTQGLAWFTLFLVYLHYTGRAGSYTVLFMAALMVELLGTSLGCWSYNLRDPHFGLSTTNPPLMIGGIYGTLMLLVKLGAGWLRPRLARFQPLLQTLQLLCLAIPIRGSRRELDNGK